VDVLVLAAKAALLCLCIYRVGKTLHDALVWVVDRAVDAMLPKDGQ
jgi:hypothetical protein